MFCEAREGDSPDVVEENLVTLLLWEHGNRKCTSEGNNLAKEASKQCAPSAACLCWLFIVKRE